MTSDLFMRYATDPGRWMELDGCSMSLNREPPLARLVKARLRTYLALMQRPWAKYDVDHLPSGPLNFATSYSPHLLHTFPTTTIVEECVFGTLSAVFKAITVRTSPLGAVATTMSKMDKHSTPPLTQSHVPYAMCQVSNANPKNELEVCLTWPLCETLAKYSMSVDTSVEAAEGKLIDAARIKETDERDYKRDRRENKVPFGPPCYHPARDVGIGELHVGIRRRSSRCCAQSRLQDAQHEQEEVCGQPKATMV